MSRDPELRLEDILFYFRTEDAIIWDSATIHNPVLVAAVKKLLQLPDSRTDQL